MGVCACFAGRGLTTGANGDMIAPRLTFRGLFGNVEEKKTGQVDLTPSCRRIDKGTYLHLTFERLSGRLMQRNPKQRPRAFGARPRR